MLLCLAHVPRVKSVSRFADVSLHGHFEWPCWREQGMRESTLTFLHVRPDGMWRIGALAMRRSASAVGFAGGGWGLVRQLVWRSTQQLVRDGRTGSSTIAVPGRDERRPHLT